MSIEHDYDALKEDHRHLKDAVVYLTDFLEKLQAKYAESPEGQYWQDCYLAVFPEVASLWKKLSEWTVMCEQLAKENVRLRQLFIDAGQPPPGPSFVASPPSAAPETAPT